MQINHNNYSEIVKTLDYSNLSQKEIFSLFEFDNLFRQAERSGGAKLWFNEVPKFKNECTQNFDFINTNIENKRITFLP